MKLLVAGITGFIGRYLADELPQLQDLDLTILVRPRSARTAEFLKQLPVKRMTLVESGIPDPCTVQLPHGQFEAVINLVGPRDRNPDTQWNANVEYVRRLMMVLNHVKVNRLIHVSSAAVYGLCTNAASVTESNPPTPTDWYGVTKLMGERIVERFHRDTRTPTTILRPSWVVGHGSHLLDKHLLVAHQRRLRLIIPLSTPANIIYVRDVAKVLVEAIRSKNAGLEVYNINSPARVPFSDFVSAIDREVKGTKIPVVVPLWMLRLLSLKFPFVRSLFSGMHMETSKARDELGFRPQYDLPSMVKEIVALGRHSLVKE
jgi:UDP-glucose 4-epimerase